MKKEVMLIKLGLSLSPGGFKEVLSEWIGKESEVLYVVESTEGEPKKKYVKKEWLMKTNTIFNITHKMIAYSIWCFPEDLDQARKILREKIIGEAKIIKGESDKTFSHIQEYL